MILFFFVFFCKIAQLDFERCNGPVLQHPLDQHKLPVLAKMGKDEPKEPSGASKSQKAACSKTLKNPKFLHVFGSRGIPRKPQDQNVQKKTVKKTVKKNRSYHKQSVKKMPLW